MIDHRSRTAVASSSTDNALQTVESHSADGVLRTISARASDPNSTPMHASHVISSMPSMTFFPRLSARTSRTTGVDPLQLRATGRVRFVSTPDRDSDLLVATSEMELPRQICRDGLSRTSFSSAPRISQFFRGSTIVLRDGSQNPSAGSPSTAWHVSRQSQTNVKMAMVERPAESIHWFGACPGVDESATLVGTFVVCQVPNAEHTVSRQNSASGEESTVLPIRET